MGRKNRKKNSIKPRHDYYEEEDDKGFEVLFNLHKFQDIWNRLDPSQLAYAEAAGKQRVVGVNAGAGTGKTTIATMRAFELLKAGKIDKIHYVRFPDSRSLGLGFIPGPPDEKEKGFMYPFFEACAEIGMQAEAVTKLIGAGVIELSTDIHLRGRTMDRVFLIVDEAQNGDIPSLRLVLTRIKENGYAVVIGHSEQVDSRLPRYGPDKWTPFEVYLYHMNKKPFTSICELQHDYRGMISRWADKIGDTIKELEAMGA